MKCTESCFGDSVYMYRAPVKREEFIGGEKSIM